jgi:2-methylisocitrate lyase-like PEP mutase family enzyme
MVDRIRAARDASTDLVIGVRTEALSARIPMEETLARGVAYAEAGVDFLFFAGMRIEDFPKAADTVKVPLYGSFNVPLARAREAKVKLQVFTSYLEDIAAGAMHNALLELKETGQLTNATKNSIPREISTKLLRNQEITDLQRKYNMRD